MAKIKDERLRTTSDDGDSESVVDRTAVTPQQDKERGAQVEQKGDFSAEY